MTNEFKVSILAPFDISKDASGIHTGTRSGYFFLIFSPSDRLFSNGWSSLYCHFILSRKKFKLHHFTARSSPSKQAHSPFRPQYQKRKRVWESARQVLQVRSRKSPSSLFATLELRRRNRILIVTPICTDFAHERNQDIEITSLVLIWRHMHHVHSRARYAAAAGLE